MVRTLDVQKVSVSENTKKERHWSGATGMRRVGQRRGRKGRQAQPRGRQCNSNRRQHAQTKGDYQCNKNASHSNPFMNRPKMQTNNTNTHHQNKSCQGANECLTNKNVKTSDNIEEPNQITMAAATSAKRGAKRKQARTGRGTCLCHRCSESRRHS